jgi:3-hydroxyisobutyrate dehydrogenase-like beta-hydroxyacid dehydrogenase
MKVGFIGLGNMGAVIAANLLKAGHSLTVYNRTKSKAASLQSGGARVANTPAEAASGADVIITMLADDHALETVAFGKDGVLEALPAGAIHISMSTISVALSRKLADAHIEKKQRYVAAPVFGRPEAAAAAKLYVVAAGDTSAIENCRELFSAIGQRTFEVGEEAQAANLFKLNGNFLITTVIESLAETFALVRKSGYDQFKFLEVMTESLFNAPVYKTYGKIVASEQFDPPRIQTPARAQRQSPGPGGRGRRIRSHAHRDAGRKQLPHRNFAGSRRIRLVGIRESRLPQRWIEVEKSGRPTPPTEFLRDLPLFFSRQLRREHIDLLDRRWLRQKFRRPRHQRRRYFAREMCIPARLIRKRVEYPKHRRTHADRKPRDRSRFLFNQGHRALQK